VSRRSIASHNYTRIGGIILAWHRIWAHDQPKSLYAIFSYGLKQSIKVLEAQQKVKDLQKYINILKEVFITEDFELQRKLHYALDSNALAAPSRTDNQLNLKENLP